MRPLLLLLSLALALPVAAGEPPSSPVRLELSWNADGGFVITGIPSTDTKSTAVTSATQLAFERDGVRYVVDYRVSVATDDGAVATLAPSSSPARSRRGMEVAPTALVGRPSPTETESATRADLQPAPALIEVDEASRADVVEATPAVVAPAGHALGESPAQLRRDREIMEATLRGVPRPTPGVQTFQVRSIQDAHTISRELSSKLKAAGVPSTVARGAAEKIGNRLVMNMTPGTPLLVALDEMVSVGSALKDREYLTSVSLARAMWNTNRRVVEEVAQAPIPQSGANLVVGATLHRKVDARTVHELRAELNLLRQGMIASGFDERYAHSVAASMVEELVDAYVPSRVQTVYPDAMLRMAVKVANQENVPAGRMARILLRANAKSFAM